MRSSSASSSTSALGDGERDGAKEGGWLGTGRMKALSREGGARRGSVESLCVDARRREVQMQW